MAQPTAAVTYLNWMSASIEAETICPVDASGNAGGGLIYPASFVGENASTGYHRQFVAADRFVGVALRGANNSGVASPLDFAAGNQGDGTAGSCSVPVRTQGYFIWRGAITGLVGVVADQDTPVYCTDGQTLTTASGGGAAQVGIVTRYDANLGGWIIKLLGGIERRA